MVLPSLMDANTTVIWEAMAMWVPTLALDHFGFHDTIKDGVTGFLVKPTMRKQVVTEINKCLESVIQTPDMLKKWLMPSCKAEMIIHGRRDVHSSKKFMIWLSAITRIFIGFHVAINRMS